MLEDRLLIWRFNRGERDVLRRIYEKYKNELVTLAAALLNDKGSAEDVVHDVFVRFINRAEKFRITSSIKGYLVMCVANNARNINKTKQRERDVGLDTAERRLRSFDGPEDSAMFGEELRQVAWSLWQLPYEQREVIMLRLYSGMRFKAIAEAQGESINRKNESVR
jgi:RNA polymerase sigma-70 factor (ECF subfamily)